MQDYAAWEIIRQRADEMRAQARRDTVAKQARKARHNQEAGNREAVFPGAQRPGMAGSGQDAGAEVIPMPRVPDYVDGTFRDAGPRSHAC